MKTNAETITKEDVEIKNLRTFTGLDGYGFSATVYIKGQRAFRATDRASGGPMAYEAATSADGHRYLEIVESTAKSLERQGVALEAAIGAAVDRFLTIKKCKKYLKQVAYLKSVDGEFELRVMPKSLKPTKAAFEKVKSMPWWLPTNILLNELPEPEAIAKMMLETKGL